MKVKNLMLATAAALGFAGAAYSTIAYAQPNDAHIYQYFADPSMNELVGESGNGCHAGFHWGIKTAYYTYETFSCN
jgi:hypothetical protein